MVARLALAFALLGIACGGVSVGPAATDPAKPRAGILGGGLLGPAKQDAYGPGVHSDATGRPFEWQTQDGQVVRERVKPDVYGPGVGMDPYGRPVRATPR